MTFCGTITDFQDISVDFRVKKYVIVNGKKTENKYYDQYEQADIDDKNSKDEITFSEYLKFVQKASSRPHITQKDLENAENIDIIWNNPNWFEKGIAVENIGESGDRCAAAVAVSFLKKIMAEGNMPSYAPSKEQTLKYLIKLAIFSQDQNVAPVFIELLDHKYWLSPHEKEAEKSSRYYKDPKITKQQIIDALNKRDLAQASLRRSLIAEYLGNAPDRKAVPGLIDMANNEDINACRYALEALVKIQASLDKKDPEYKLIERTIHKFLKYRSDARYFCFGEALEKYRPELMH
jgi:HEAT repeat protein